ncbi:probable WRKY transcription factor 29 [Impatiens glandulifera]|uniref:probable WRKY transcription factor 29 n=1 Tax=Impatiens glandulifera TaxID=253017 RepID=UPI001FB17B86|nr:probable WRKY transcription factor 29 [Impatiens glandulifera]
MDEEVDWDLQAVVSSHGDGGRNMCFSSVMDLPVEEDYCSNFGFNDELGKVYRPFCPGLCNNISSSHVDEEKKKMDEQEQEREQEQSDSVTAMGADNPRSSTTCSSLKTRKNEKKRRVVIQVTAESLSSDLWAWRKYGQKPIKGSPFPRCSSSKGCLARKQVERSCTDSDTFVITYTGDHCHSRPTRRSSLAGTSRQKFSSSSSCCDKFV